MLTYSFTNDEWSSFLKLLEIFKDSSSITIKNSKLIQELYENNIIVSCDISNIIKNLNFNFLNIKQALSLMKIVRVTDDNIIVNYDEYKDKYKITDDSLIIYIDKKLEEEIENQTNIIKKTIDNLTIIDTFTCSSKDILKQISEAFKISPTNHIHIKNKKLLGIEFENIGIFEFSETFDDELSDFKYKSLSISKFIKYADEYSIQLLNKLDNNNPEHYYIITSIVNNTYNIKINMIEDLFESNNYQDRLFF